MTESGVKSKGSGTKFELAGGVRVIRVRVTGVLL